MKDPLHREKSFLLANVERLAAEHPGKYLVIQGETVYGAFETYEQGVEAGLRRFPKSAFLVRSVLRPEDGPPVFIPTFSLASPITLDQRT